MAAKTTKNNGIVKKQSKLALYEKNDIIIMFFSKINALLYFFTLFVFYLTYKCAR